MYSDFYCYLLNLHLLGFNSSLVWKMNSPPRSGYKIRFRELTSRDLSHYTDYSAIKIIGEIIKRTYGVRSIIICKLAGPV